jgi:hypothetical protein
MFIYCGQQLSWSFWLTPLIAIVIAVPFFGGFALLGQQISVAREDIAAKLK